MGWLRVIERVTLACALLVGAVLLVRSFNNLSAVERGLDADGVMVAWISLPARNFADRPTRLAVSSTVEAALRGLPGVSDFVMSFGLPPGGGEIGFGGFRSDDPNVPEDDRAALGASRSQIRWHVLRDGLAVALPGLVLGAACGFGLTRGLASFRYGIGVLDPLSWTIVIATLACATLGASALPAAQAARVDPAKLLREE